jgi:hypothetical protein
VLKMLSMDRNRFWELLETVDREALCNSDDDDAVAPLVKALSEVDESQICSFEEHLAQVLHELDGRDYADQAGQSGGSDDGFLYARCFVVASGRGCYEGVAAHPESMPKSLEWCEALLYVAQEAWTARTGREAHEWKFETSVSYATGSNKAKWP